MNSDIQMELLKRADGKRVLRFEHPDSGLSLEKRLESELPVIAQKERWQRVFEALLAQELAVV